MQIETGATIRGVQAGRTGGPRGQDTLFPPPLPLAHGQAAATPDALGPVQTPTVVDTPTTATFMLTGPVDGVFSWVLEISGEQLCPWLSQGICQPGRAG